MGEIGTRLREDRGVGTIDGDGPEGLLTDLSDVGAICGIQRGPVRVVSEHKNQIVQGLLKMEQYS